MDENMQDGRDMLEGIAFVGETLGPFYLQDPVKGDAGPAFAAMAAIDVAQAAVEWPFVDEAEARCDLDLMRSGLAEGIDADGLVWEYRRLFIGPAPKPAPPWGSVYTDRDASCSVRPRWSCARGCALTASRVRRTTRRPRIMWASCWCSWPGSRATSRRI